MPGRMESRQNLIYFLQVFDRKDDTLVGHLVDIAPQGLMVMTDHRPQGNAARSLRLELPQEVLGARTVSLEAVLRWCRADAANPEFYRVGFRISEISPPDASRVQWLIENFPLEDSGSISYDFDFDVEPPGGG